MKSTSLPAETLRSAGFRATPRRIKLLSVLAREHKPLAVKAIRQKLHGELDEATLYRALEALVSAGIVQKVHLGEGSASYELSAHHHHHIVCTKCGAVEDFSDARCDALIRETVRNSRSFARIDTHAFELFGLCRSCQ